MIVGLAIIEQRPFELAVRPICKHRIGLALILVRIETLKFKVTSEDILILTCLFTTRL